MWQFGKRLIIRLRHAEPPSLNRMETRSELDTVDQQQNVNQQSVSRVEAIAYCLPQFRQFSIAGLYFPNPFILHLVSQNDDSIKNARWDGWLKHDKFARGNQRWSNQVLSNYQFSTQFEWQQYWFTAPPPQTTRRASAFTIIRYSIKRRNIARTSIQPSLAFKKQGRHSI